MTENYKNKKQLELLTQKRDYLREIVDLESGKRVYFGAILYGCIWGVFFGAIATHARLSGLTEISNTWFGFAAITGGTLNYIGYKGIKKFNKSPAGKKVSKLEAGIKNIDRELKKLE